MSVVGEHHDSCVHHWTVVEEQRGRHAITLHASKHFYFGWFGFQKTKRQALKKTTESLICSSLKNHIPLFFFLLCVCEQYFPAEPNPFASERESALILREKKRNKLNKPKTGNGECKKSKTTISISLSATREQGFIWPCVLMPWRRKAVEPCGAASSVSQSCCPLPSISGRGFAFVC